MAITPPQGDKRPTRVLSAVLLNGMLGLVAGALALALAAAAWLGHLRVPPWILLLLVATTAACNVVEQAIGLWLLFRIGGWKGGDGEIVLAASQRRRSFIRAAAGALLVVLWAGVAAYVVWMLFDSLSGLSN